MHKKSGKRFSSIYIFPLLVFIIVVFYLYRFFFLKIDTEIIKFEQMEDSFSSDAIIIRNEISYTFSEGSKFSYQAEEGQKVPFQSTIVEIVKGNDFDDSLSIKIEQLNERIKDIESNRSNIDFFKSDREKLDSHILKCIDDIKKLSKEKDFYELDTKKRELIKYLYKKSLIDGNNSFSSKNIEQLIKEKEELMQIYNNNCEIIKAKFSGIVSYEIDNMENILVPSKINALQVSDIDSVLKELKSNNGSSDDNFTGVKIVDNSEWYLCMIVSSEQINNLKQGDNLKLRFSDCKDSLIDASVYTISSEDNGKRLITFKIDKYLKDFYKSRIVNVEIVKKYYEGFIVPLKAVITQNNKKGIYIIRNGIVKYVPVNVLLSDSSRCLITNIENADEKLQSIKIKPYDEVITTVDKVNEGQLLLSNM